MVIFVCEMALSIVFTGLLGLSATLCQVNSQMEGCVTVDVDTVRL